MSVPTIHARITADTLNRPIIEQIIRYLESSRKHGVDHLTVMEWQTLADAADNLTAILSWQTPEEKG